MAVIPQHKNIVVIEGLLSEVDLKENTYAKDGKNQKAISGTIKVQVNQEIEGEMKFLEIPVSIFANKITNADKENQTYKDLEKLMNKFNSVAAAGASEADYIRVTGASIEVNEFLNDADQLVRYPRIRGSFINKIRKDQVHEHAVWEVEAYIAKIDRIVDKEGVETGGLEVTGIVIGWKENPNVVKLKTHRQDIASAIESMYEVGQVVPFSGLLDFSSTTETYFEEVAIGEPLQKTRTINQSDLIITGARAATENDIDAADIKRVLDAKQALVAKNKAERANKVKSNAKAPGKSEIDLGF